MKVTDAVENPNGNSTTTTSTKQVKKVTADLTTIPPLKKDSVPSVDEGNNSNNGADASCSSGGEEPEQELNEDMNGSSNGASTPPTPSHDIDVVNHTNGQGSPHLENGASDKENSKPGVDHEQRDNKGISKRSRSNNNSNSNKRSTAPNEKKSHRNSGDEKNGINKTANGANTSENENENENGTNEDVPEENENDESTENKGDGKADQSTADDIFYVHDAGLTIKIVAPGAEPFEIQVSSSEIVQELHQLLMEREDTCHRTCFSLQLEGITLDNFAELKSVADLKDGSTIRVVDEPYTCREARIHVKHVRDLLKPSDWADAYAGTDCASLSFLNAVSGGDLTGKKRVVDCTPPDCIMPGTANSLLLCPIHPLNKDQKPISCLKVLAASGWNPPPGYRKLHGDLMYILVVTLEDKTCHITASPRGFYLNRSTMECFDPLPAHPNNFLSHSLIELLNQISTGFRKTFTQLQKRRMARHPFERVATPYQVYSWVSPNVSHNLDAIRAEEAFSSKLGYEEHIPGQTRDWNEELQSTRELPRATLPERLLRERAIFKVHSDFVSAATRGAVAVIDGNIMAINPGESHKMQMYIWSNIFFSLGFDVRDHYKELGGDAAAHVAPRNDLQGVAAYNAIDLEGLYTLGTVVIDYRGYRVTAQSIIPGILEREQDQSVVYGSIDFGKTVVTNDKYLDLLKKAASRLKVLPHYVSNEKDEVIELCSSVECKGIIGNDGRHYILDLLRTFPPDVNFLNGAEIELNEEARELGYPLEHPHKLCCLRQELVDSFVESRYMTFIKVAAYHLQKYGFKAQVVNQINSLPIQENILAPVAVPESSEPESTEPTTSVETVEDRITEIPTATESEPTEPIVPTEPTAEHIADATVKTTIEAEAPQEPKVAEEVITNSTEESTTVRAIRNAATSVCSLSLTEFDLRFNPDIFSPSVKHTEPSEEQLLKEVAANEQKNSTAGDNAATENSQAGEEGSEVNSDVKDVTKLKKYPSMEAQIRLNKEACDFLLLFQIPTFIRDITANSACALDSGSTFFGPNALVMDGITLSAAMHLRGINIRYLGRIVTLLLERESFKDSESKIVVIPTSTASSSSASTNSNTPTQPSVTSSQNLPHFMTTIAVTEIITRSTKHVFNPYIQSVDAMFQSLAISHFLNCLLMTGQPVPPIGGDELTPLKRGAHRNKNRQQNNNRSRQPSATNGPSAAIGTEWTAMTQASLWEQIKLDMRTYYGFTLPEVAQESIDICMTTYGIQRMSLLRSFTLKTGVQILLREYQFNKGSGSTKSGSTSCTFSQEDILNVFPVVKHIDPKASDAYTFLNTAQSKMSSGFVREGFELLSESLNLLNNVYGAMHPDIALCLRSLARLNYVMGEYGDAMAYQQKALFMAERLLGVDHPTTILEYTHLSLYCFANNQVTTALKLLYRARYLSLLVCGENHPHVALLDSNIGLILHAVGEYELSLKFLEKALDLNKKYFGARSLKTAVGHHLVARTQSCIGDFRSALMNERETYSIYKEQLGPKHEKTQEASECLAHLTQQAVVLQRKINDMAHGKGLPPIQIQPPSMGSVLDMLNLINGILFMQISQQDIEIIKAELEQRARETSPNPNPNANNQPEPNSSTSSNSTSK